ncbi:hypothetical protein D3C77_550880 [compost metagenome]
MHIAAGLIAPLGRRCLGDGRLNIPIRHTPLSIFLELWINTLNPHIQRIIFHIFTVNPILEQFVLAPANEGIVMRHIAPVEIAVNQASGTFLLHILFAIANGWEYMIAIIIVAYGDRIRRDRGRFTFGKISKQVQFIVQYNRSIR